MSLGVQQTSDLAKAASYRRFKDCTVGAAHMHSGWKIVSPCYLASLGV